MQSRFDGVRPQQATSRPSPAHALRAMYATLLQAYGPQQWWPAKTALEVVVGAYLTQNTSWRAVERSIANLRLRRLLSVERLRDVSEEELRGLIRPSGYMVRKAAAIKAFIAFLDREVGAIAAGDPLARLAARPTSELRPRLLALPGVGPETADSILCYALGHPAVVVDEYLRRVVTRHGLAPERASYDRLQQLAGAALAEEPPETLAAHANEFHALIVRVGKTHCGPRPRCHACPLAGYAAPIPRIH